MTPNTFEKWLDSSNSDGWCSPTWIAEAIGTVDTDPCTNVWSVMKAKTEYLFSAGQNGLKLPWFGRTWINPPYSDPLPWCRRAVQHQDPVTMLLKFDCSTEWFSVLQKDPTCLTYPLKDRVQYVRPGKDSITPPWCSMIIMLHHDGVLDEIYPRLKGRAWNLKC